MMTQRDLEPGAALPLPRVGSRKVVLLLALMSVIWATLMDQFGEAAIYWIMGPYALAVAATLLTLRGGSLRPTPRLVGLGVLAGGLMTAATYPAFQLANRLFPELAQHVAMLYRESHEETLWIAVAWTLVILTAEELLWRGAWIDALAPRLGSAGAAALSVVIYAITQFGSGSLVVLVLAACCGGMWAMLRVTTDSLVPSLVAHAIWTPTVILLVPVV